MLPKKLMLAKLTLSDTEICACVKAIGNLMNYS
jgi:hypothetical protein